MSDDDMVTMEVRRSDMEWITRYMRSVPTLPGGQDIVARIEAAIPPKAWEPSEAQMMGLQAALGGSCDLLWARITLRNLHAQGFDLSLRDAGEPSCG